MINVSAELIITLCRALYHEASADVTRELLRYKVGDLVCEVSHRGVNSIAFGTLKEIKFVRGKKVYVLELPGGRIAKWDNARFIRVPRTMSEYFKLQGEPS